VVARFAQSSDDHAMEYAYDFAILVAAAAVYQIWRRVKAVWK
jgi:hypothetical protein